MENIFDTNVLVQVVPNLKTSQNWLLDRFFPNVVTYETEEVAIDVDVGLRRMAPFVSPLVEGKLVEQRKYQTNTLLTERGANLASFTEYQFDTSLPSLVLSERIYQDPAHNNELVRCVNPVHPAFMPLDFKALSK